MKGATLFNDDDFPTFETAYIALTEENFSRLEELAAQGTIPHGVDPWSERHWLTHAIASGKPQSIAWVLSKGVDVGYIDDQGFSALKSALQLEADCKRMHKTTPSHAAAITIQIIDMLVAAGVDVNQRLPLNYVALHAAVAWSSICVIRHLLECGADPTLCNTDSCTSSSSPLADAKSLKRWDVYALMCEGIGMSPAMRPL